MKVILITGATGGIGEALANKLAERKHNLLLVARNANKLAIQCKQLAEKYAINTQFIVADLAKSGTPEQVYDETQKRGLEIEMLINNAGIGSGGEFSKINLKSELELLQLNISSVVALTHLFLPHMQMQKKGIILNVASMAAFMPVPYMATYAASKMFVRSFTEAITEECKPHNVHVLLLCPGLTKTNFNKASKIDNEIGKGLNTEYSESTQTPEQVADEALKALDKKKNFIISGTKNRLSANMLALVPNSAIAKGIAKSYRKKLGV